jgi:predicted nucleotidyltransferase
MRHLENTLPPQIQAILDRFVAACHKDERLIAAFLTGSYARGTADAYSDLDFCLITRSDAYQDFITEKKDFIRQLGKPLFLEDFNHPDMLFSIFSNDVECELAICSQDRLNRLYSLPYRVLVDKKGLFPEVLFTPPAPPPADQSENLRGLISWFWHDFSHFITALGRGQLWWAAGQIEVLRGYCVSLARLQHDFSAEAALDEPYFKIEKAISIADLAPLQATFCPLEPEAMLQSARLILHYYQELAHPLTREHRIDYPQDLERLMLERLNHISPSIPRSSSST